MGDQVDDAVGKDAGFAAASTRQNQQRPGNVLYRGPLLRVECRQTRWSYRSHLV